MRHFSIVGDYNIFLYYYHLFFVSVIVHRTINAQARHTIFGFRVRIDHSILDKENER